MWLVDRERATPWGQTKTLAQEVKLQLQTHEDVLSRLSSPAVNVAQQQLCAGHFCCPRSERGPKKQTRVCFWLPVGRLCPDAPHLSSVQEQPLSALSVLFLTSEAWVWFLDFPCPLP